MAEYKIIPSLEGYSVEVRAPGSFLSMTGFPLSATARATFTVASPVGRRGSTSLYPGARHKVDLVEHGCRFPTNISDKPTFRMRGEFAASEQPERRGMMLKQGAAAPAIECPDRGYPRRRAIELSAEAIKDFRRNALHSIERVAGHFEKAAVERERQPVQGTPTFSNPGKFLLVEREEMLDLKC
jgi:hypothetical protein